MPAASTPRIELGCTKRLDIADERQDVISALEGAGLKSANDHLRWIEKRLDPTGTWRVDRRGILVEPAGRRQGQSLVDVVALVPGLRALQHCQGFPDLLLGLSNPVSFQATRFEVFIAARAAERAGHASVRLHPAVPGASRKADLAIVVEDATLWVECKSLTPRNSSIKAALARARASFDPFNWEAGRIHRVIYDAGRQLPADGASAICIQTSNPNGHRARVRHWFETSPRARNTAVLLADLGSGQVEFISRLTNQQLSNALA